MYGDKDFRLVKPILNKIRKYPAMRILAACINKIRYAEEDPHNRYGRYQPWTILLLIKWALLYGDEQGPYPPKEFEEPELDRVLSDIWILDGHVEADPAPLRGEKEWFLYWRKKSFQQFPFQDLPYSARFARQNLLFGRLPAGGGLSTLFFDRVGAPIEHVLELCFVVMARFFQQRQPFITEDWFRAIEKHYPPNTVKVFLQELSNDFMSAKEYLFGLRKQHAPVLTYELSEMSPLKRFPLFLHHGKYYCYSPMLLFRALENYLYDTLRYYDAQYFCNEFGRQVFEKYVGRAAQHTELPLISEEQLLERLGQNGNLVDYLIVDRDAQIFIDAKAVEITYIGEVSEEPDHILQRIDSSVIKGIKQAYSVAQRLEGITHIEDVPLGTPTERFLLIVTYKDMYLGCGRDFYHYIAKDRLDKIAEDHGGSYWIPFEHIYVLSIEDFDLFVEAVHQGRIGMADCLRRIVIADGTAGTHQRKLVFKQHLHEILGDLDPPTYLDAEFEQMTERVASKLHQIE